MTDYSVLLSLRNVVKGYGRESILKIPELHFYHHQSVLLHGSNGSGKSTLLRLLGHISSIGEGAISYQNILKNGRLGFLPQEGGLYKDLTVRENLYLRRLLYGLPQIPPKGLWYVEDVGLSEYLDRRVAELSGGYQRLAALAAILHISPCWLLLDEPLNGIDAETKLILKKRFAKLIKKLDLCVVAAPNLDGDLASNAQIEISQGQVI